MEMRIATAKSKRADLQGLRGVAILLVLVMHLKPNTFRFGFVGVDIFFVLSGYLMSRILQHKEITAVSIMDFYGRRFKRIVPLYMIAVAATYTYGYFRVIRYDREQLVNDLLWVCTFASNLQPIFQRLGYFDQLSKYRFFVHTWSLGVELQYYLIAPVLTKIASYFTNNTRLRLLLFLAASSVAFHLYIPPNISYGFPLSRIWQFLCGAIVNELITLPSTTDNVYELLSNHDHGEQDASKKDIAHWNVCLTHKNKKHLHPIKEKVCKKSYLANILLVALFILIITNPKQFDANLVRIYATCMAGALIYLNADVFLLTNRCIVYCGGLSYVLYLVHWPVIVAVRYCSDSRMMTVTDILIVIFVSYTVSAAIHHTLEKYFIEKGVLPALICVIACYEWILCTKDFYLYAPTLESIDRNTSKVEYAIEWNMRQLSGDVYLPCGKDDTQLHSEFKGIQWRCIASGNGTANIILVGNSFARRAYPLIHNILKGRYRKFRLLARSGCPPLLYWCDSFTGAVRRMVQQERPDILLDIHCIIVGPIKDLETDATFNQYQSNIDFISIYTKYIVIDMPYYKHNFLIGAELARKLRHGLSLGDEFVITWKEYIKQTRFTRLLTSSINCTRCIFNDIAEGLFPNGSFLTYDPVTFLARISDEHHLTPVGLELLRPLYTRILEKLLQELSG